MRRSDRMIVGACRIWVQTVWKRADPISGAHPQIKCGESGAVPLTRGRIRPSAKTPRSARAPNHEGGAAYSRLIVWRAAQPTSRQGLLRDAGSLQIVHSLSGGQRPRTPNSISLFIEPLGACQGRRERRLRLLLGASDRGRRRLDDRAVRQSIAAPSARRSDFPRTGAPPARIARSCCCTDRHAPPRR